MPWSPRRRALSVLLAALPAALLLGSMGAARAAEAPARPGLVVLPAHAQLTGTTPEDGSTVDSATEVVLTFNEDVNPDFVQVAVEGPGGSEADGDPVVDGQDVTQALSADLAAGDHEVTYRVVSTDGHPVSGSITFTSTAAPSPSASPTPTETPSSTASSTPTETPSEAATPSPTASPDAEPVSDSGPSTWTWVAVGVVVLALLAAFITIAARSDRGAGGRSV